MRIFQNADHVNSATETIPDIREIQSGQKERTYSRSSDKIILFNLSFTNGADSRSAPFVRYETKSRYFISRVLTICPTASANRFGSVRRLNLYSNSNR